MRNEIFLSSALAASMLLAVPAFPQSIVGSASVEPGQLPTEPTAPGRDLAPDWGTSANTAFTKVALDFTPYSPAVSWGAVPGSPGRYAVNGSLEAGVLIPAGAKVLGFELEGCDTSATGGIYVNFNKQTIPGGGGTPIDSIYTGGASVPGCAFFVKALATPETIDNFNITYWLEVGNTVTSGVSFSAVRVYYLLQVSPKPGVATFTDVPLSHPFNQYVEALYSSGITAGCGSATFCPDAPVTRGQMAVFLSKALGLHWAP